MFTHPPFQAARFVGRLTTRTNGSSRDIKNVAAQCGLLTRREGRESDRQEDGDDPTLA